MGFKVYITEDAGDTWSIGISVTGVTLLDVIASTDTGLYFVITTSSSKFIGRTRDGEDIEWYVNPYTSSSPVAAAYGFAPDELIVQYADGALFGLQRASQGDVGQANAAAAKAIAVGSVADQGVIDRDTVYWIRYPVGNTPLGIRGLSIAPRRAPAP